MPDNPPSTSAAKVPAKVWLAIFLSAIMEAAMQVIWKGAISHVDEKLDFGEKALAFVSQPMFLLLIALAIAQFFNWMRVLAMADLSFAKPISSLSYFATAAGSILFLHAHVSVQNWIGIAVIFAGIWLISGTGHKTIQSTAEVRHDATF